MSFSHPIQSSGEGFSGSGCADGSQHYFYILFLSSTTHSCVYYLERVLPPVAFRSMSKRLLLTEKSYPIFELKNAGGILSERIKQDVECARVDFSCFTLERDLKAKSYWLGNPLPCTAGFLALAGGAGLPALLLQYLLAVKPTAPHSWGGVAVASCTGLSVLLYFFILLFDLILL